MSLRRLFSRFLPTLALLLCLMLVLDACTTRRRSGGDDDDNDTTSNDDDDSGQADDDDTTGGDDDDTTGGDDDDTTGGDDDDTTGGDDDTGDDDDSTGDDDDSTGDDDDDDDVVTSGVLDLSADSTNFGTVTVGSQVTTTVYFENVGGTGMTATVSLSDLSGVWIVQGGAVVNIAPFSTETRTLLFQPGTVQVYNMAMDVTHDGSNPSPQQLFFYGDGGSGGGGTESSCIDGVDNDGDTLIDCADPDCATNSACTGGADPCCTSNPQFANGPCQNGSVESCVCSADSFCCTDWDTACVNLYDGTTGHCGPSGTCP